MNIATELNNTNSVVIVVVDAGSVDDHVDQSARNHIAVHAR